MSPQSLTCLEGDWITECYAHRKTHPLLNFAAGVVGRWDLVGISGVSPLGVWTAGVLFPGCHGMSSFLPPCCSSMCFCLGASQLWTEPTGNYEPINLSSLVRYCVPGMGKWLTQVTSPLLHALIIIPSGLKYDQVPGVKNEYHTPVPLPLGTFSSKLGEVSISSCSLLE